MRKIILSALMLLMVWVPVTAQEQTTDEQEQTVCVAGQDGRPDIWLSGPTDAACDVYAEAPDSWCNHMCPNYCWDGDLCMQCDEGPYMHFTGYYGWIMGHKHFFRPNEHGVIVSDDQHAGEQPRLIGWHVQDVP